MPAKTVQDNRSTRIANQTRRTLFTVPLIAWLTLLSSLTVTALVWRMASIGVEKVALNDFLQQSSELRDSVHTRMRAYEQVLQGGVGLFLASESVRRGEWRRYVEALNIQEQYPGIQGIGFSKHLQSSEVADHVANVRAEGFPEYTIKPPGKRSEYTAIIFLEPFDARNQRAFGYDMFSEPTRRAAMEMARDTGHASLSGKVTLKQEMHEDIQAGFLLYVPLYRRNSLRNTVTERRSALLGYVYSPFRVNDLMNGILSKGKSELNLKIYDGSRTHEDALMYSEQAPSSIGASNHEPIFSTTHAMNIQGRDWLLEISSTPLLESKIDAGKPRIVIFSGVLISLLFMAFVWSLTTRKERAMKLARVMTQTVREREAFIQALVETAADGIITIDEKRKIISYNNAAKMIFGYEENEVLGQNIDLLITDYNQPKDHKSNVLKATEKPSSTIGINREGTGVRKNGEEFPLELSISEVDQAGKKIYAEIIRDITQRKQSEDALKCSEERFDLAIKGANDGLWDWDLRTNKIYYSPRWKEMLGYREDDIGTDPDEWRTRIHVDDLIATVDSLQRSLDEKTPTYQMEHRMRHKNGHYIWVLERGITQRNEKGEVQRIVGIHTDITQRKHIDKMKNEFISTVSHELRTPLTSIRGSLGLIMGGIVGVIPEQALHLLEMANRNSEQLLALINELLDIEKLQSGTLSFELKDCKLEKLITHAIEVNQGYAQQFSVQFVMRLQEEYDLMIHVDQTRFLQVMSNLLSNAVKFSPENTTVTISIQHADGYIRIEIADKGIGIPDDFCDRIFEKFTQADSSDTRHKGGTGLGLNICKLLVEQMGGQIGFESQLNIGTTFHLLFPLAPSRHSIKSA